MSLSSLLEDTIKEYLNNNEDLYDIISGYYKIIDIDYLIEAIDAQELATVIESKLKQQALKFSGNTYSNYLCEKCGRSYGDFLSQNGQEVSSNDILKNGKEILIVDVIE